MSRVPSVALTPGLGGLLSTVAALSACAPDATPDAGPVACAVATDTVAAAPHDFDRPAGVVRGDTIRVDLLVRPGSWAPEAADGPRLASPLFVEHGRGAGVPGPLIRGRAGAVVRADVCNGLSDTLWIAGLAGEDGRDTVWIAPGEGRALHTVLADPGTRVYEGLVRRDSIPATPWGGQLVGLLHADAPAAPRVDEIMLLTSWNSDTLATDSSRHFGLFVNGRSWPHTKRLRYEIGDTARWIVATNSETEHPMHLHGFHFLVTARGDGSRDTLFSADRRRLAVTEVLFTNQTMQLEWVPERGGRWLFHCHFTEHIDGSMHDMIAGREPGDVHAGAHDAEHHARTGMAGLVVGIEVAGDPARGLMVGTRDVRRARLVIQSRDSLFGEEPGYGYVLERDGIAAPDSIEIPGSRIDARRGEALDITIVNRLDQRTAIHWHGLEIESYFDGVPGWTGDDLRTTPFIEPGDSFTVRIVPVRAGTYMYHSHFDDLVQLGRGLFAPFIVTEGDEVDASVDHTIVFSMAGTDDESPIVANNGADPAVRLAAARENRIRFINISPLDVVRVTLLDGDGDDAGTWRVVAHDGADLPPALTGLVPARLTIGAGETVDVVVTPTADLRLDVRSFNDFVVRLAVGG